MSNKSIKEPLSVRLQRFKEAKAKKKQEDLEKKLQSAQHCRRPLHTRNHDNRAGTVPSVVKRDPIKRTNCLPSGQKVVKRRTPVKLDVPPAGGKGDDFSRRLSYSIDSNALISVNCKVTGLPPQTAMHTSNDRDVPVVSESSTLQRKSARKSTSSHVGRPAQKVPVSVATATKSVLATGCKTAGTSFMRKPVGIALKHAVPVSSSVTGTTCTQITRRERLAAWRATHPENVFSRRPPVGQKKCVAPMSRQAPVAAKSRASFAVGKPEIKPKPSCPLPRSSVGNVNQKKTNIVVSCQNQASKALTGESRPKGRPRLIHVKARTDSNFQGTRKSSATRSHAADRCGKVANQNKTERPYSTAINKARESYPMARKPNSTAAPSPGLKRYSVPNCKRVSTTTSHDKGRHSVASRFPVKSSLLPGKQLLNTSGRTVVMKKTPLHTPSRFKRTHLPPLMETTPLSNAGKSPWARNTANPTCTPLKKEASRRERLISWMKSRGRTPSKFSHLLRDDTFSGNEDHLAAGLSVDQLAQQQQALDSEVDDFHNAHEVKKLKLVLLECLRLLETDCPVDICAEWVCHLEQISEVKSIASYWVLKARVAEVTGCADPISIYEQAVHSNATPPEEVATALQAFVQRMSDKQMKTPKRPVPSQDMFTSSAVKFCVSETADFFSRVRSRSTADLPTPVVMVTPVRRSTRRSCANLPTMLRDHDVIVSSLDEVPSHVLSTALHRQNETLTEGY